MPAFWNLVRFHGDGGGRAELRAAVVVCAGGGACAGGEQSGLSDFILAVVEQDVGGVGLQEKTQLCYLCSVESVVCVICIV